MSSAARSRVSSQPRSGYSDPAFVRIAELAQLLAGLVFPPNRQPSAEAGMRRAMSVLRVNSPAELLRLFETPGASRDAVLAELTVGESYFFREAAQLELLPADILPARRSENSTRPLRLWSAGCASGEEPYTLGIMLRELGWSGPSYIRATDIALPRLAAAQRGRYTRWALRGVSEERITRWFTRNGNYFDLAPTIRDMVDFRAFNLVVDTYPDAATDEPFDLVLCRNVMIYFELPTVARIAEGLLGSLAPDGWLVLGASDPPLAHLVKCESIMTPAGMAYRRAGTRTEARMGRTAGSFGLPLSAVVPTLPSPASESQHPWSPLSSAVETVSPVAVPIARGEDASIAPATNRSEDSRANAIGDSRTAIPATDASLESLGAAYRRADYQGAEAMALRLLSDERDIGSSAWITYIRSVANQGRLSEAGELNARALEQHPLDAELHYLHATLLMEAGWFSDAAAAARRAIYLDRKLVVGHILLGEALSRAGDQAVARNAFANALRLLEGADAQEAVRAADGVTVSRLRQIATLRLRGVEGAAR